jgi:hypothetical protein
MTSIEFLFNELWETPKDKLEWHSILEKAKEMHHKELMESMQKGMGLQEKENNRIGFRERNGLLIQQEISDEEIEEEISKRYMNPIQDYAFRDACKWYREQLKQRQ